MSKKYRATATMTDGSKEWPVIIYSGYTSLAEAEAGAARFRANYSGESRVTVKAVTIEATLPEITAEGLARSFLWHASQFRCWIHAVQHDPKDLQNITEAARFLGRCEQLGDILAVEFGEDHWKQQAEQMVEQLEKLTD